MDNEYLRGLNRYRVRLYQNGQNTKRKPPIHGRLGFSGWTEDRRVWFVWGRRLHNKSLREYRYVLTETDVVVPDEMILPRPVRRRSGLVWSPRT